MQSEFRAYKKARKAVLEEIELAKRHKEAIVVVEFWGEDCTTTLPSIHQSLKTYPRNLIVQKGDMGGGHVVVQAIKELRGSLNRIRFCGVNTCACVKTTVEQMKRLLPSASFTYNPQAVNCECYADACATRTLKRVARPVTK